MWIYHPFKPGAVPHRCFHDLGGVFCDRLMGHPTHQPSAETVALTVDADCTHGDGCPVHPDTHAVHNFDEIQTDITALMRDARPIMSALGVTDAADVLPALRKRLTTTPAEVRPGISDRAAAALADVANLRYRLKSDRVDWTPELDRIEQALRADGGA